jgi:hypothetical protein
MNSFPLDFDANVIKSTQSNEIIQKELMSTFREQLYQKYKNNTSTEIEFIFPEELSSESKIELLQEILLRFPTIYYDDNYYVSSGWKKLEAVQVSHQKYMILV